MSPSRASTPRSLARQLVPRVDGTKPSPAAQALAAQCHCPRYYWHVLQQTSSVRRPRRQQGMVAPPWLRRRACLRLAHARASCRARAPGMLIVMMPCMKMSGFGLVRHRQVLRDDGTPGGCVDAVDHIPRAFAFGHGVHACRIKGLIARSSGCHLHEELLEGRQRHAPI